MSTVPGRGNGLTAASYIALVDVPPPVADELLETLRREAIAAYAAPATDRPLAELQARATPMRPLDRVFVDRSASGRARALVDAELPRLHADPRPADVVVEAPGADIDEDVWAGLVAAFDAPAAVRDGVDGPPPVHDGDRAEAERAEDDATGDGSTPDRVVRTMSFEALRPAPRPREEAEEHFVPPAPPPLPALDPIAKFAWLGVLGTPILTVVLAILGFDLAGWSALGLAAAFVAGSLTLVARMQDRDDEDDDGAVV